MPLHIFDTNTVDDSNQFDYWNELVCNVFIGLDCLRSEQSDLYQGIIKVLDIDAIEISMVHADASNVLRNEQHISKSVDNVFMLHLQIEGTSVQSQQGNVCELRPGDLAICQSSEPYSLCFDEHIKMLVVKIPYWLILNDIRQPELLAGLKISQNEGISNLLIEHIKQIWLLRESVNDLLYNNEIGNTLSSLLSMTVRQAYPELFGTTDIIKNTQLLRLKSYIRKNLSNPNLSPSVIAQANGISSRYMRKIFSEEETTCSKQISNLRIGMIAEELKDRHNSHTSISQIAFKWGFNNVSHFSRAFKDSTGMSPSSYRKVLTS